MENIVVRWRKVWMITVVLVAICSAAAFATEYYVSPNGTASSDGSINRPWDIATALKNSSTIKGGDTIWLRGGTYGNGGGLIYQCTISGKPDAPVKVRQYRREQAKVDAGLEVSGSYVWLWGFELTNSALNRRVTDIDKERPRGIVVAANTNGVKIINMVIHDVGRAGVGGGGSNLEIYGTILWGNGIYDRVLRGDATYLNLWHQMPDPRSTSVLKDNIAFRNFYSGFKIYSEWPDVFIDGFELEGNISFDNGGRSGDAKAQANLLVRSEKKGPGIKELKVQNNYTYRTHDSGNPYSTEFGCMNGSKACGTALIRGNYFASGASGFGTLKLTNWANLEVTANTIIGRSTLVSWTRDAAPAHSIWGKNAYYGATGAVFKSRSTNANNSEPTSQQRGGTREREYDVASWKTLSADFGSAYMPGMPTENKTFVRRNVYEPGERAHIIVYNWQKQNSVTVDLAEAGLREGSSFEIVDVQNYFGRPVLSGTYHGKSSKLSLPMNLAEITPLIGAVQHLSNQHTAPEFAVFVVRTTGPEMPAAPLGVKR